MIAKAKSISHGINDIRYITGETENKEHPERILHVCLADFVRCLPAHIKYGYTFPV